MWSFYNAIAGLYCASYIMQIFNICIAGPPSPIGTITVVDEVCSVDFTISWDPVTSNPVCGSLLHDVMISPSDGVMMMRITDTSYNFTGLIPATSYTVTVVGRNDAGVGQSMITNVTTHNRNSVLLGKFECYLCALIPIIDD